TGKSTLIKMIMGNLEATSGKMRSGVNLDIAYFDQHREALDLNQTVQEIVGEGKQEVVVNGKPRHVLGYLQDFLFSPKRARTPVRALSGGEKNRLLLARLFLRPSNLLILDEPTNDLDIETLELLEEVVANYAGTVILVSHDRDFVNNCVNSCLYFDGTGHVSQIVGGYDDVDDYLAYKEKQRETATKAVVKVAVAEKSNSKVNTPVKKKRSFKEKTELENLPGIIDELETSIADLQEKVNHADFFSQSKEQSNNILNQLAIDESKLEVAYARWQELDD
ncbi:MAG: ATP-binding cassette subfamily F protein uup, partial [Cognaticolwellia sp.]